VRINQVAPYLRRSKLVYLSSCNSGNAGFALEAARQGIPAVVGFRWSVRDDYADIHARLFYRTLFKERAIDTALWKTRRAMHRRRRGDRTWASSMLVMQSR
jgi:CHAT domain-containing protein